MQRLSICFIAMLILTGIFCASFTKSKAPAPAHKAATHQRGTFYYYYLEPGDTYDTLFDQGDEIFRLEAELQVFVDTNPFGGTLVAKGFTNTDIPHDTFAASVLYAHYDDFRRF